MILQSASPLRSAMRRCWGRSGILAATACVGAALAGCAELRPSLADAAAGDPGLCAAVPVAREQPAANAYQQAIQRDECIHRFSYRFARVRDDADAVVGAVIGACRAQIDRSATMLGEGDPEAERFYLAEMERAARERAMYRVIQARAGDCR